ncbi:lyase family protein [Nonomuraea aurantiaca]|uniref:lyase family protein n=1 Tax=Nonomuraea aurantiaca TaxID=2878562 RepID=UPI001CD9DB65|nr:lyase family protein [Nonomuraea aurantiaca]MCA2220681.1 3-carboxy-cis,cis-muconate cycloisomerase [Nonomuraea aurantiaca]
MTSDGTAAAFGRVADGTSEGASGGAAADSGLLAPVRAGTRVEAVTSDAAWLRAMLDAEAALARAQSRAGLIPGAAAALIDRVASGFTPDLPDLAQRARQAANPVVPLVADLRKAVNAAAQAEAAAATGGAGEAREAVGGRGAAVFVHRGATSQDICDSAAMLVAARAVALIAADLDATMDVLAGLAERHRGTLMAARTLGQQAVPTTFGLKAASWLTGLLHARDRLAALRLPAQLGGAAGTLAALVETARTADAEPGGGESAQVRVLRLVELYAEELGLAAPLAPWHAERSVTAELGAALAGTAGALGKVATDVILMAQTEVGEVAESSRGGSSAMPQKRNPALSVLIRSAALQVPAYAQLLGQAGEHERAAGAWQAEWSPLRECLRLTGGAAETAAELIAGLQVFPDRMRENACLTGGRIVSERLAVHLGRDALDEALSRPGPLEGPEELLDPEDYLGAAPELVDRLLADYRERRVPADYRK